MKPRRSTPYFEPRTFSAAMAEFLRSTAGGVFLSTEFFFGVRFASDGSAEKNSGTSETPLDILRAARLLDGQIFAFLLAGLGSSTGDGGKLTIGSYEGRFHYQRVKANYPDLWAVKGRINAVESVMVLDSGSIFIVLPIDLARMIFGNLNLPIEAHNDVLMATYPCAHPPLLIIQFGRVAVTLTRDSPEFERRGDVSCS
ncbi:hypothetical protein V8E36_001681 [Tilletia maclaganii]